MTGKNEHCVHEGYDEGIIDADVNGDGDNVSYCCWCGVTVAIQSPGPGHGPYAPFNNKVQKLENSLSGLCTAERSS